MDYLFNLKKLNKKFIFGRGGIIGHISLVFQVLLQ